MEYPRKSVPGPLDSLSSQGGVLDAHLSERPVIIKSKINPSFLSIPTSIQNCAVGLPGRLSQGRALFLPHSLARCKSKTLEDCFFK